MYSEETKLTSDIHVYFFLLKFKTINLSLSLVDFSPITIKFRLTTFNY